MFGKATKRMSGNDKFVMAMGKKVGNLPSPTKQIKAAPAGTGLKTVRKAPSVKVTPVATKAKSMNKPMKRGVQVNQNRPQSLGKSGTFSSDD
jgi:hypothetical protein